jgi:hypothetical protein
MARASPPPFSRDSALRTVFMATMSAPDFSSKSLVAIFSSSVTPSTGAGRSADAPPEIRHSTRSLVAASLAILSTAAAASAPFRSGSGCDAPMTVTPSISVTFS